MNKPTAVGVHIYAGGFTEGMRHNLDVKGHYETSKFGVDTTRLNLKIESVVDSTASWKLPKVNVIYGNPPCVAFSRLGHQERLDHPTIQDVRSLLRVGLEVKPDVWTWECVCQAFTQGKDLIEEVKKAWLNEGYDCTIFLTDANLHGAAQRRHRFHFVASRVKLDFKLPARSELGGTAQDALKETKPEIDVKNLQVRKYLQWMERYALPGLPLRRVWFHLHGLDHTQPKPTSLRFCPPFGYQRLSVDRPACTLTGGPDFVHFKEWRVLSPGEMAILSGYPSDWKWLGSVIERYKQVAKGVTPSIGRYLGRVFAEGINRGEGVQKPEYRVIDFRPYSAQAWVTNRPPTLSKEWWGIAENNQIKKEVVC